MIIKLQARGFFLQVAGNVANSCIEGPVYLNMNVLSTKRRKGVLSMKCEIF